eukprot:TRINITY_DN9179_c0_g1_i10.p1 TRINITY_DN9179_c0_g1~~TRINITY_DN9179_c0_g1_i10.p1  ORF type:complete len:222 (-),score=73.20 TRINITY_DN9179_c0_g1_i10:415-1080(-)
MCIRDSPQNAKIAARVKIFIALAPVAYVHHQRGALLNLIADMGVAKAMQLFGLKEFLGSPGDLEKLAPGFCRLVAGLCDDIIQLVVGPSHNLNKTRMAVYVSETPAGTSVRNMVHWAQGIKKQVFQRFDYGSKTKNTIAYGQDSPPVYKLADVSVPVALFSGGADYLADPTDVEQIVHQLPTKTLVNHTVTGTYAHLDYTWGVDANQLVYPKVLDLLSKYA